MVPRYRMPHSWENVDLDQEMPLVSREPQAPPNIIRRDAFRRKKCDNAIPMLNDGGDIFLFFSVYLSAVFTYGKWLSSGICPLFTNRQNRCTIKKSCQTKNNRNILIFI